MANFRGLFRVITLTLALATAACGGLSLGPSDSGGSGSTGGSDTTQYWVGTYNGASDFTSYVTGTTYTNNNTHLKITKDSTDKIDLELSGTNRTTGSSFSESATVSVSSSSSISASYQTGKWRHSLSLGNSGGRVTGSWKIDSQRTDGGWDPYRTYTLNVSK